MVGIKLVGVKYVLKRKRTLCQPTLCLILIMSCSTIIRRSQLVVGIKLVGIKLVGINYGNPSKRLSYQHSTCYVKVSADLLLFNRSNMLLNRVVWQPLELTFHSILLTGSLLNIGSPGLVLRVKLGVLGHLKMGPRKCLRLFRSD